jgi:hypothetical protein
MKKLLCALVVAAVGAACGPAAPTVEVRELDVFGSAVFGQTADPALAVDPETGDLLMTWVAEQDASWDLYFARSSDGGASFSEPVRVNDVPHDVHPHAEGAPRLVAAPGIAAVFWTNVVESPARVWGANDLRFSRSTDGGATWEPARTLQDDSLAIVPGEHTFHGATFTGDSTLVVAWLEGRERDVKHIERAVASGVPRAEAERSPDTYADATDPHDSDAQIFAAVSNDFGRTWETRNRRITTGVCPCCRVSLAGTPSGEVVATWRHHFGTNLRDPVVETLFQHHGEPVRVHADNWSFPGCPHSGPALDLDESGTAHVAWFTGAEGRAGIHYARRPAGAETFEPPVPIAVAEAMPVAFAAVVGTDDGGALVAHTTDASGRRVVMVSRVRADGSIDFAQELPGPEGGTHPQLALLDEGRAVVSWTTSTDGVQSVRTFAIMWSE